MLQIIKKSTSILIAAAMITTVTNAAVPLRAVAMDSADDSVVEEINNNNKEDISDDTALEENEIESKSNDNIPDDNDISKDIDEDNTYKNNSKEISSNKLTENDEEVNAKNQQNEADLFDSLTYGALTYTVNNNEVTITGCNKNVTKVTVPSQIDNMDVVAIGDYAFLGCESLRELILPDGIKLLGACMIQGTAIKSITIPKTVKSSGFDDNGALAGCSTLKDVRFEYGMTNIPSFICMGWTQTSYVENVYIPSTVIRIGGAAFRNCKNLTGKIIIPQKVESIEDLAFENCEKIESVEFIKNTEQGFVRNIGMHAFSGCIALSDVKLSGTEINIEECVFSGCKSLRELVLPEGVKSLGACMIEGTAISSITIPKTVMNSGLYFGDGALAGCNTLNEVRFEEGMTKIPDYICSSPRWINSIEKVYIPSTVTSIGYNAFYNCKNISGKIIIPKGVNSIESNAFRDCEKIESIEFIKNDETEFVRNIGEYAFSGCIALSDVELSETETTIEDYAFSGCTSLKELVLPEGVTSLGICMIQETSISSITIPTTVTDSKYNGTDGALTGCNTLKEVRFKEGISEIPDYICISGSQTSYIEKIDIPSTVTSIGSYAFYNCKNIVGKVVIPKEVKIIGSQAFRYCEKLESVEFIQNNKPRFLRQIKDYAFSGCTSLSDVKLSETKTAIRDCVFLGCTSLKELVLPEGVTSLGGGMIQGTSIESITIPKTVTSSSYTTVNRNGSDGALACCSTLKEVIFEDGITKIPDYICMTGGSYVSYIEKVYIPSTVTSIGAYAFENCKNITGKIVIPEKVNTIGPDAFRDCKKIEKVEFIQNNEPEFVMTIREYAFDGCSSLTDICIPNNVTSIYKKVFTGCSNLNSIRLPRSLKTIYDEAFDNDTIKDVYYPGSEEEFKAIAKPEGMFSNAVIHYNSDNYEQPAAPEKYDITSEVKNENGQITVTFVNNSDDAVSATGVAAEYDENGRMLGVQTKDVELAKGASAEMILNNTDAGYRVYVIDPYDGMRAISRVTEYNNKNNRIIYEEKELTV